jgi:hypothetical protein
MGRAEGRASRGQSETMAGSVLDGHRQLQRAAELLSLDECTPSKNDELRWPRGRGGAARVRQL